MNCLAMKTLSNGNENEALFKGAGSFERIKTEESRLRPEFKCQMATCNAHVKATLKGMPNAKL